MDLVSIVIPVYKVEEYLERCIASTVGQTYQNIEIILIDDGSPDRCPEICDAWARKDSRITVVHQANGGVSSARNAGLKISSGSYVLQLDSDDYIAPNTVATLVSVAKESNADVVICDYLKGSNEDYKFKDEYPDTVELIDGKEAISRIYIDNHNALKYAAPWSKLCKRRLYDSILYPDGKIFEDIYTTHKILYFSERIAVLKMPLFYYYQRPNSIMNESFNLQKLDYLQALVERTEFFAIHGLSELESIAYDELLHALIWEYSRTRDILHSKEGMTYVKGLFQKVYKRGHNSRRYPEENRHFLSMFNRNPECIVWYWRINGKVKQLFKRKR